MSDTGNTKKASKSGKSPQSAAARSRKYRERQKARDQELWTGVAYRAIADDIRDRGGVRKTEVEYVLREASKVLASPQIPDTKLWNNPAWLRRQVRALRVRVKELESELKGGKREKGK